MLGVVQPNKQGVDGVNFNMTIKPKLVGLQTAVMEEIIFILAYVVQVVALLAQVNLKPAVIMTAAEHLLPVPAVNLMELAPVVRTRLSAAFPNQFAMRFPVMPVLLNHVELRLVLLFAIPKQDTRPLMPV